MGGYMYAVAGGKGGVGKTTTTLNLAAAFEAAGQEAVVVDADLGMTNLGEVLGLDNEHSVHEVLAGEAGVEEAVVDGPGGLSVLAGERDIDVYERADPAKLRDVTDALRESHDVVLVDTGAGLSHEALVPYGLADGVVLVTTADDIAADDAGKTGDVVRQVDGTVLGVVVTRTDYETDVDAVVDRVGEPLLVTVPEAPGAAGDEPMVVTAPGSAPAQAYERLVDAVEDRVTRDVAATDAADGTVTSPTPESSKRVESPTESAVTDSSGTRVVSPTQD